MTQVIHAGVGGGKPAQVSLMDMTPKHILRIGDVSVLEYQNS